MRNENSAGSILDISAVAAKILGQNAGENKKQRKNCKCANTVNALQKIRRTESNLTFKSKLLGLDCTVTFLIKC